VGDSGTVSGASSAISGTTFNIEDDGVDVNYIAQTFTPANSGFIKSFEFNVSSYSDDFNATIELYEGDSPGTGFFFNTQDIIVNSLGWIIVNYPATYYLIEGTTYHIILRPTMVTSEKMGIYTSDGVPPGEHTGGNIFYYNDGSGLFDPALIDDMDFRVNLLIGSTVG
jgi:hypothetical protein